MEIKSRIFKIESKKERKKEIFSVFKNRWKTFFKVY